MVPIDDCFRLEHYLKRNRGPHVAIFDIGTRAIRLLVAPLKVPTTEWRKDTFCNLGQILNLGDDYNPQTRTIDLSVSRKMEDLYLFMNTLKGILLDHGVDIHHISAIGTAIFRWLANRQEVLDEIQNETGLQVTVLSAKNEARLNLHAIGYTYSFRLDQTIQQLGEKDVILLLDQGGGSMDVSYMTMGPEQYVRTYTFDGLGTIALRRLFFTDFIPTNPNSIAEAIERVQHYIAQKIHEWEGYPELEGKKIHAYAMGAAITNYFRGSNFTIHNQILQLNRLLEDTTSAIEELIHKHQELNVFFRHLNDRLYPKLFETDRLLDRTYGPPVYARILHKFNLDYLRICGYGLRYGAYVWQYHIGRSLHELHSPNEDSLHELPSPR